MQVDITLGTQIPTNRKKAYIKKMWTLLQWLRNKMHFVQRTIE